LLPRSRNERFQHFRRKPGGVGAQGSAVLDVIDRERTSGELAQIGNEFSPASIKSKEKHNIIGERPRQGLLLGIELVKDRQSKSRRRRMRAQVDGNLQEMGMLSRTKAGSGDKHPFSPPMCITNRTPTFSSKSSTARSQVCNDYATISRNHHEHHIQAPCVR